MLAKRQQNSQQRISLQLFFVDHFAILFCFIFEPLTYIKALEPLIVMLDDTAAKETSCSVVDDPGSLLEQAGESCSPTSTGLLRLLDLLVEGSLDFFLLFSGKWYHQCRLVIKILTSLLMSPTLFMNISYVSVFKFLN